MYCVLSDFNVSIQTFKVPEDWLHGYLKSLSKPCNDPSQLLSYTIKTLQNIYDKPLEKIVPKKMFFVLKSSRRLSDIADRNSSSKAA